MTNDQWEALLPFAIAHWAAEADLVELQLSLSAEPLILGTLDKGDALKILRAQVEAYEASRAYHNAVERMVNPLNGVIPA